MEASRGAPSGLGRNPRRLPIRKIETEEDSHLYRLYGLPPELRGLTRNEIDLLADLCTLDSNYCIIEGVSAFAGMFFGQECADLFFQSAMRRAVQSKLIEAMTNGDAKSLDESRWAGVKSSLRSFLGCAVEQLTKKTKYGPLVLALSKLMDIISMGSWQWKDTDLDSINIKISFSLPRAGGIAAPDTR